VDAVGASRECAAQREFDTGEVGLNAAVHREEIMKRAKERVLKFRWIHVADGRKPTGSSDSR
jgi:hypothetical protein